MTQVDEKPLCESSVDHAFSLILLENSFGKTKEFLMAGNSGYVGYIIGLNTGRNLWIDLVDLACYYFPENRKVLLDINYWSEKSGIYLFRALYCVSMSDV